MRHRDILFPLAVFFVILTSPGLPMADVYLDAACPGCASAQAVATGLPPTQPQASPADHIALGGNVITTLGARGTPEDASHPPSVLYVERGLWQARQDSISRFLRSHMLAAKWWPLQVRDVSIASTPSIALRPVAPGAPGQTPRAVILAADNSAEQDCLTDMRYLLPKTEEWRAYRWTIIEPSAHGPKESDNTEIVMLCPSAERVNLTTNRWDLVRHFNPFARPLRTTDYYGSGDVNLDGTFDASDLAQAEAIVAGSEPLTERADVNGDGSVDSEDVRIMQEVLSGSRPYLPGWWDRLETRAERDDWVSRMLAIDRTNAHTYQPLYFVCVHFASVLVLNSTEYDGVFFGEPSRWITPGRFNLPMCHVSLSAIKFHSINGILVGDDPLDFDSWRFIEPQSDHDGRSWFEPGERIRVMAIEGFSTPGGLTGRDLVVFQLDDTGKPVVEHADPNLVTARLCSLTITPANPAPGQLATFTVRTASDRITQVAVSIRLAGSQLEGARSVELHDDGLHDDGAAGDGVWGGSTTITEVGNLILDVRAGLLGGGQTTHQQAACFSTTQGRWHVAPWGNDSNPGSKDAPFGTVNQALQTAFPGDRIEISPGFYDELVVITKGHLEISRDENSAGDVSLRELHVQYGTGIHVRGISCSICKVFGSNEPIFDFCTFANQLFSFSGPYLKLQNCLAKEVQAQSSAVSLSGCLISNPGGMAVLVKCPRTTEPALVPLQISNCTVVNSGVGVRCTADNENYPAALRLTNCILWGNGFDIENDYPQIAPVTCDIEDGWAGEGGNISSDPMFMDPSGGDFRLAAASPCIDAGTNEDWMWDALDLDGNPRIWRDDSSWTVDIGAYEYPHLPFRCTEIATTASGEAQITWNSRPGNTYEVWSCFDLRTREWNREATVSSDGETTTWSDRDTTPRRKFYRIGIE